MDRDQRRRGRQRGRRDGLRQLHASGHRAPGDRRDPRADGQAGAHADQLPLAPGSLVGERRVPQGVSRRPDHRDRGDARLHDAHGVGVPDRRHAGRAAALARGPGDGDHDRPAERRHRADGRGPRRAGAGDRGDGQLRRRSHPDPARAAGRRLPRRAHVLARRARIPAVQHDRRRHRFGGALSSRREESSSPAMSS